MRKINKEVATLIQERLDIGAKKYGRDIPINDKRDFLQESIEEALDNAIYLACYLIQIKQRTKMNKQLLRNGKDLEHGWFSESGWVACIDELNNKGFEAEYRSNGQQGHIIYPNYRLADAIVSNYVGSETMIEFNSDHKYLEDELWEEV